MAGKVPIQEKFDAAVKAIASLPPDGPFQPSNELKLKIYGCYKQATVGPCNVPRPSFWEVVNKAKWDSWAAMGQMNKEEAMRRYVEEIGKFVEMMPQNSAVRDLTEKLNVYEWVESGSSKSYGDSGIECNGNDERSFAKSLQEDLSAATGMAVQFPLIEDSMASSSSMDSQTTLIGGNQDFSSASETNSVKENPRFRRISRASVPEDEPDDPTKEIATKLMPAATEVLENTTEDTIDNVNTNATYNATSSTDNVANNATDVSSTPPSRVGSKNSLQNSFSASMLVGSAGLCRHSPGGPTEEETRKLLLSMYDRDRARQREVDGAGESGDLRFPVFNSNGLDIESYSETEDDDDDDEDDDDEDDDDDEYCDSGAPLETEKDGALDVPTPPSTVYSAPPSSLPPPQADAQSPDSAMSPFDPALRSASLCSTDSELYVTPSMVTPEEEADDAIEAVADATNALEREVKKLVDVSLYQVDKLPLPLLESRGKAETSKTTFNKEDLNFPLANEIRARPGSLTPKMTRKTSDEVVVIPKSNVIHSSRASAMAPSLDVRPKTTSSKTTSTTAKTTSLRSAAAVSQPTTFQAATETTSPRYHRSTRDASPDRDEIRILSDIEDVALRPSTTSVNNHRLSQVSANGRSNDFDSSSSDSSHSSAWSPTGASRRRNFEDWPIRSGDELFKARKSGIGKGCGRRHRDSDTTSAGGGGGGGGGGVSAATGGGRGGALAHTAGNAIRGRGGQSASSRGRSSANIASSGGAGGLPPPYPPPVASAVNEQIAVALLRIQQDVSTLNARINTLETLFWTPRNGANGVPPPGVHGQQRHFPSGVGDSGLTPPSTASVMKPIATTILNWLFPGFSLRSVVFLLLWPILAKGAYLIVKALIGLALMKRRRFIDGHDDLPPL